jgi:hypothetical protein
MTVDTSEGLPALGSRGIYAISVSQAQASANTALASGPKRLLGWSIISGAASSTETVGQVTSPAAGATIATLTNLPAGDYSVTWTVELAGTLAAADANNFQLLNGVTVVLASDNQAVAGVYNQPGVVVTVPANGSISIQAIALGTVGAVYRAQLVVSLLAGGAIGNVLDGSQIVGVISTGADQVDVQWMGDHGIYLGTQVSIQATVGKLSGCIYVRDLKE